MSLSPKHEKAPDRDPDENNGLRKGTWSLEEDEILAAYVKKHGEGNWNEVQNNSGLARCGKSCRFRWLNNLKPDLKKGSITKEEEQKIFQLYSKFGTKWCKIAQELPGRTDNEIKNFWNARKRKLERAGLPPLHPSSLRGSGKNSEQGYAKSPLNPNNNTNPTSEAMVSDLAPHPPTIEDQDCEAMVSDLAPLAPTIEDQDCEVMVSDLAPLPPTIEDQDCGTYASQLLLYQEFCRRNPPFPQLEETQYQLSEPVSVSSSSLLKSLYYPAKVSESSDVACCSYMHSNETTLENGKGIL